MRFDVVTLFPDMFGLVRDQGVTGAPMRRACGRCTPGTRAISPTTCIARSTTAPTAAAQAW